MMGGDHRAVEHRLIQRHAHRRFEIQRAKRLLQRHRFEEHRRLLRGVPVAYEVRRLRVLGHLAVTPADHRGLHAVGKQDTLGGDRVAVFGACDQLRHGVDPAGGIDIAFGVLCLSHAGVAAIAVEQHAGGVGIEKPGIEASLGVYCLHPCLQQRPHTTWIRVVAGLLETGFQLAVFQHDRAVAVGLGAQVGSGPIGVFRGGQGRFVGVVRRHQKTGFHPRANRFGMPEATLPTFAQGQQQTLQPGVAQGLNGATAPGLRAVTQGSRKVHGQFTAQLTITGGKAGHVWLLHLPGLPGLGVDRRVEAAQEHGLFIAIQCSGLRQQLCALFVHQALEFMAAQPLDQSWPITHIAQSQQAIVPEVHMAGAQQFLGFGCLPQFVRQRLIAALLQQPLAVALGTSQWVGIAQVQPQRHRRIRRQRGEFMGRAERQAVAVGLPLQAVVVGVGQQPAQGEATVIHAPQRQAQVLGGIELAPLQQKRLPDGIAGRHVMPLGQGPDQPSPHGLGRLTQQGQLTGLAGVDGQGQVALLQAGGQAIGAVVPLPSGLIRRVLQLADGMRGHTTGCLH